MQMTPRGMVVPLCALAALIGAVAPSAAEWLVLRDGGRLEIRGGASVEKRRVVFTLANGTLSALPVAEVDLDATAEANRPAAPPAAPAAVPAASRAPVVRLTDADFAHADDVGHPTVLFFTTTWCPVCRTAREALSASGVRYDERDVESDPEARRQQLELAPEGGVPVLAFEDEVLLGFSRSQFDRIVAKWRAAEAAAAAAQAASLRPAERGAAPADSAAGRDQP